MTSSKFIQTYTQWYVTLSLLNIGIPLATSSKQLGYIAKIKLKPYKSEM